MFTEKGEVLSVEGNEIIVACEKKKTCSCCRYAAMCSMDGKESFSVINTGKLRVQKGDVVYVGISEVKQFFGICLVFLFPLIVFVGILVFCRTVVSPFFNFLIAFGFVAVYYVIVKLFLSKWDDFFSLRIIKVIKGDAVC